MLFHNPESLDDGELKAVRRKINMAKLPQLAGLGLGAYLGIMRAGYTRYAIKYGVIGLAGGFYLSQQCMRMFPSSLNEPADRDILNAFEQRYVNTSLNASGYGNNSLNAASHTKDSMAYYKKPY